MYQLFYPNGLGCESFVEFREWTNLSFPLHCHYTFEAVFIKSGELVVEKQDVCYTLKENDALVIMPFEPHVFVTNDSSEIFTFQVSPNNISSFDGIFKNKIPKNPCCHFAQKDFDKIYQYLSKANLNQIETNYIFFVIIESVLRQNELVSYSAYSDLFTQAITYISNHYEESITLYDVAQALNISRVHLSRIFSSNSKMNFNDCLNGFRMQNALKLLSHTSLAASDVCFRSGFGSIRNFNRVFSKMMGCTPKEFKNCVSI